MKDYGKRLKQVLLAGALALCIGSGTAAQAAALTDGQELPLWPDKAPGSEQVTFHNTVTDRSHDPAHPDRIMTNIDRPTMTVHLPEQPNGTALIVGPGGGYARVVLDKEGNEIADWLTAKGVTVFILHYRLPSEAHNANREDVSLEDGQRAVRILRSHAAEWNLKPDRIGIMGFSAGGHMAASTSTCYDRKVYEPVDAADQVSARPDFSILGYPVISMLPEYAHKGTKKRLLGLDPTEPQMERYSAELYADWKTPPAFIFCAEDDDVVPPVNSLLYFNALRKNGVEAELHVYAHGKHGFGLGKKLLTSARTWPEACENWLRERNLIK